MTQTPFSLVVCLATSSPETGALSDMVSLSYRGFPNETIRLDQVIRLIDGEMRYDKFDRDGHLLVGSLGCSGPSRPAINFGIQMPSGSK
jgi:hypothetical protein